MQKGEVTGPWAAGTPSPWQMRHLLGTRPDSLTLFSADWFLCVASRMVMNCRYWGLVQRPTPGGGKQDEQVSGREQETGKQKAPEEK